MEENVDVTRQLAQLIVNRSFSDIPRAVKGLAKYTIIDTLGCCIAGYTEAKEECEWIINLIKDLGGTSEASVFMSGFKTSAPFAALANGTMIHSIDFDDTHMGSISHFSASLVPTVFSLAERIQADGPRLLEAFVIGFEVGAKVGRAMMPSHYKYWHPTSTFGSLASAAAASKLLKLDEVETEYALGLAADPHAELFFANEGAPAVEADSQAPILLCIIQFGASDGEGSVLHVLMKICVRKGHTVSGYQQIRVFEEGRIGRQQF